MYVSIFFRNTLFNFIPFQNIYEIYIFVVMHKLPRMLLHCNLGKSVENETFYFQWGCWRNKQVLTVLKPPVLK